MGEMKPTPGPWKVSQNVSRHVVGPTGGVIASAELSCKQEISEANARLIAEAGTVFHNTGLSPVQLVEMVKELRTALQDAEEYISGHTPTNSWGLLDRREDADRCETLEKVRAALAKCEGVGNE